ncbi:hypothetical protein NE237_009354 [Protea cynaroides]|uniref:Uncharacterized protein n=1 Tax=Protea cynaroides TaxID=273540 RepID=A0A9Q0KXS9_9MAGN|nr:hypothetical protein NE237_009354 [Protea cynaroides]
MTYEQFKILLEAINALNTGQSQIANLLGIPDTRHKEHPAILDDKTEATIVVSTVEGASENDSGEEQICHMVDTFIIPEPAMEECVDDVNVVQIEIMTHRDNLQPTIGNGLFSAFDLVRVDATAKFNILKSQRFCLIEIC